MIFIKPLSSQVHLLLVVFIVWQFFFAMTLSQDVIEERTREHSRPSIRYPPEGGERRTNPEPVMSRGQELGHIPGPHQPTPNTRQYEVRDQPEDPNSEVETPEVTVNGADDEDAGLRDEIIESTKRPELSDVEEDSVESEEAVEEIDTENYAGSQVDIAEERKSNEADEDDITGNLKDTPVLNHRAHRGIDTGINPYQSNDPGTAIARHDPLENTAKRESGYPSSHGVARPHVPINGGVHHVTQTEHRPNLNGATENESRQQQRGQEINTRPFINEREIPSEIKRVLENDSPPRMTADMTNALSRDSEEANSMSDNDYEVGEKINIPLLPEDAEVSMKGPGYTTYDVPMSDHNMPYRELDAQEDDENVNSEYRKYFSELDDSIAFEIPELHVNCWLQAMMASTWGYGPSCNDDGSYGPKQCHEKRCWCVNRNGEKVQHHGGKTDSGYYFGLRGLTLYCSENE